MKKTLIALMAAAGLACAVDVDTTDYFFSTTAAYSGSNGGTYQGVMFKLTTDNPLITVTSDASPVTTLPSTVTLDSITIQLRNTAAGTCADGRYMYIADSSNKLLAISDNTVQTTQGGNMVFNFSEEASVLTGATANKTNMLTLNTNESYYAYFGKDDAVLRTWSIGETTIPSGQVYSVQLAAIAAPSGSTTSDWGFMNGGLQNQASTGYVPAMSIATHVPEPATATLSLLALAGLASRRRRH